MTRRDLDSGKLRDAHHKLGLTIQALATGAAELGVQIAKFQQWKTAKEEQLKELEFERELAQRALVIVKNIPNQVLVVRRRMQWLTVQFDRKDLRVSEIEKYKIEFRGLQKEIKRICSHPLVVKYPGGHDSDENTSWPGSCMCALCCFEEKGIFVHPGIPSLGTEWMILAKHPERILCWKDSHKLEDILRQDNRWSIPTEDIIGFFLDSRMLKVQDGKPIKHLKLRDLLG